MSYVSSLANQVPTSANVEYYARIVERTAVLRRLIHAAGQIAAVAYNEPDATVALDEAEKLVFNVSQRFDARTIWSRSARRCASTWTSSTSCTSIAATIVGVATGFSDLDKMTGGLQKSDLVILAARPAVGKTAMALSLAHNAAMRFGHKIGDLQPGDEQGAAGRAYALDGRWR